MLITRRSYKLGFYPKGQVRIETGFPVSTQWHWYPHSIKTWRMERKTERKQLEDFDDILTHVGGWGNFQYRITLVFFLFNIFLGYVFLSPIITLYTPPHWCHIPGLANLSMEQRRELAIPRNEDVLGKPDIY